MFTHKHTVPLKSKLNPDLARKPSALSPLSAVAPSDEPPVAASPPFLHHTLYLERSIQIIIYLHISENNKIYKVKLEFPVCLDKYFRFMNK